MRFARLIATATFAAAFSALSTASAEVMIYATNHQGSYPNFGDTLVRFPADHPELFQTIGPMTAGNKAFGCLEFDGNGNLWTYASHNSFGGAASGLYSVNINTGAVTQQGTLSSQTLTDIAWNPVDQTMYGVYSQGLATPRLYTINLSSGAVTVVSTFTGLDAQNNLVGLAIDAGGKMYLFDNINIKFYVSDLSLNATLLYGPETQCDDCFLAVGSQGITIDWSRDNKGYHGAVGQEQFPTYYNNINTFSLDGLNYVWGPWFGNHQDGVPLVQPGDVAVQPNSGPAGDLNFDGVVNVTDLFQLLASWGACDQPCPPSCVGDLNDDCTIDVSDLFLLLANWTN